MPILKNAKKALRASERKADYNRQVKSKLKTALDKMVKGPSPAVLSEVFQAVDKAVKRHLVHRNKAARLKSKMSRLVASK